ncbi:MAG: hypothetical protein ABFD54_06440 [Armatimonadota bacterium]|nr:hypothetical protein [bacterium]
MARKKTITDLAKLDDLHLLREADGGSQEAMTLLQQHYDANPGAFPCADMPKTVAGARMVQAGLPAGTRLALQHTSDRLLEDVAGKNPTPLEKLLAERIVACWLDVQILEVRWASAQEVTCQKSEYFSRMLDRAHSRYLSAIKVLAQVRRLNAPLIQLNVADKQINVLSGTDMGNEVADAQCASGDGA